MVWKKMEILKKKRMIVNDCVLTSLGAFDFHRSSIGIFQQFRLDLLSLIYLKDFGYFEPFLRNFIFKVPICTQTILARSEFCCLKFAIMGNEKCKVTLVKIHLNKSKFKISFFLLFSLGLHFVTS